ncbi:PTS sugar transporter subunit IIB [Microbacterium indicum]|uniref:PTS sugar transporter subunit IIB n=1 Tax=Microbacterium indicum TaxID=358100 RepID=UPI00056309AB|nr:hypothetical protein [Microbacterium indicum]
MRISVVCGAGASSTFVASRLQRASAAAGTPFEARASALSAVDPAADAILLGAHLAPEEGRVRAAAPGVPLAVLPADIAADRDGTRALAIVRELITGPAAAGPTL